MHALGLFPAGEVSRLDLPSRSVCDGPWQPAVAGLIRRSTVVPVFFEGRNSAAFQLGGLVHPRLRTALLPRELLSIRHTRINVHIGSPIPPDRLSGFDDEAAAALSPRPHLHPWRPRFQRTQPRPRATAETRTRVRACIGLLPDSYRTVLLLRDSEGLDTPKPPSASAAPRPMSRPASTAPGRR